MRLSRRIAGYALLRVTGLSPERVLTGLAGRGIPFWNAEAPRDYEMTLRVPARRAAAAGRIAAAAGCGAEVLSLHGLPRLAALLKRRRPAAALALIAALALLASHAFVWQIRIEGNETVPDGVILQALEECGVTVGARWTGFSQDAIRNGVILRIPEIRWMTVTMRGSCARVIVREKRTHEAPVNEAVPSRIMADRAGLVTAVEALHGTAETEPGRAVLPGETLIGGYTTGRFGIQGPAWAAGTVRARTWYELTAEAPAAVTEKVPTGRTRTRYALIFGKNRINFYEGSSICTPGCDKIIETVPLGWENVFSLPAALVRITETRYETVTVPAEELREELDALLTDTLLASVGGDGRVLSAVYTASGTEDLLRVTLRAECEEQIGVTVPLTEEERAAVEARVSRNLW